MTVMEAGAKESLALDRLRARDEVSVRAIIRKYNRRLYRIARGILRDEAEAEDAVQEAYLKAFTHIDEFRGDAAFGTWLCRIVMNEALGRLRRRRPALDWSAVEDMETRVEAERNLRPDQRSRDPEIVLAHRQISRLVERAIDQLPEEFRLVLIARAVEEMSIEETATLLDVRQETVKTRLHRARRLLRSAIETQVGSALKDVFPFEDPRCERMADNVIAGLTKVSGNLLSRDASNAPS